MKTATSHLRVTRSGDSFLFEEINGSQRSYLGKLYYLSNERNYALIFDKVIPSEGMGPPGLVQKLLDVGTSPLICPDDFLQEITERAARETAKKLAKEKELEL